MHLSLPKNIAKPIALRPRKGTLYEAHPLPLFPPCAGSQCNPQPSRLAFTLPPFSARPSETGFRAPFPRTNPSITPLLSRVPPKRFYTTPAPSSHDFPPNLWVFFFYSDLSPAASLCNHISKRHQTPFPVPRPFPFLPPILFQVTVVRPPLFRLQTSLTVRKSKTNPPPLAFIFPPIPPLISLFLFTPF